LPLSLTKGPKMGGKMTVEEMRGTEYHWSTQVVEIEGRKKPPASGKEIKDILKSKRHGSILHNKN